MLRGTCQGGCVTHLTHTISKGIAVQCRCAERMPETVHLVVLLVLQQLDGLMVLSGCGHELQVLVIVVIFRHTSLQLTSWTCTGCHGCCRLTHEVVETLVRAFINLLHALFHGLVQSVTLSISITQLTTYAHAILVRVDGILLQISRTTICEFVATFRDIGLLHLARLGVVLWFLGYDLGILSQAHTTVLISNGDARHSQTSVGSCIVHAVLRTLDRGICLGHHVAYIGQHLLAVSLSDGRPLGFGWS